MSILLDTHVWLWSLLEPERLSAGARAAVDASGVELHLSPVSVWEAMLLIEKGRVTVDDEAQSWFQPAEDIGSLTHREHGMGPPPA